MEDLKVYKIHIEKEICIAHQLQMHSGKCHQLHGHNLIVTVDAESSYLLRNGSSDGMIVDFGEVKQLIDTLDHTQLNEVFGAQGVEELAIQPTAERVAEYLAGVIVTHTENSIEKITVRVYETRSQYAEYTIRV